MIMIMIAMMMMKFTWSLEQTPGACWGCPQPRFWSPSQRPDNRFFFYIMVGGGDDVDDDVDDDEDDTYWR